MNGVKGEVSLKLGSDEFVLSTTMDDLANLSSELGRPAQVQFLAWIYGTELSTVRTLLRRWVKSGTVDGKPVTGAEAGEAAWSHYRYDDAANVREVFSELLGTFMRAPPKRDTEPDKDKDPNA